MILCTYGDTMRVPASKGLSLLKAKARGADIRMVYSAADALRIAREQPGARGRVLRHRLRDHHAADRAGRSGRPQALGLANFSVFCNHVLTPAAITQHPRVARGARAAARCRSTASSARRTCRTVIGSQPYEYFAEEYRKPVVIAGFEPLDVMQAILMLVRQVNEGRAEVENEFTRAVTREGNVKAQALVAEVFELRRTLRVARPGRGAVQRAADQASATPRSTPRRASASSYRPVPDNKACECGAILRGVKKPADCKVFGTVCTPENPIGSCMVSSEGACAAHYTYGRFTRHRAWSRRAA